MAKQYCGQITETQMKTMTLVPYSDYICPHYGSFCLTTSLTPKYILLITIT